MCCVALHLQRQMPMVETSSPAPGPPPKDHLERNLSRFRRTDPELADAIAGAETDDVEIVSGPTGQTTLSFRGTLLASAYDPAADGARLAGQVPEGVDLVVALGFGTGQHLEALHRSGVRRLLVFEPHTDLLKGALGVRPFPLLDGPDVRLVHSETALVEQLSQWYSAGLSLHVLTHPGFGRVAPEALRFAVAQLARTKETLDLRSATLRTWARHWALTAIENASHLAGCTRIGQLKGAFSGAPAVICAAGPSLGKQLPELARHRDRFLVIAIGQSLAALEHAGIRPDLVLVTETQDVTHQLASVASLGDQNLVLVPQSHSRLFELAVGRRFAGFEASNPFSVWLGEAFGETEWLRSGGTVAVSAVYLAAFLGAEDVMLIGQDLAFTGGKRYAEGSLYEDLTVEQEEDGSVFFTNLKIKGDLFGRETLDRLAAPGTLLVEGWYGDEVLTDRSYASFREEYRAVAANLAKEGVRVFNCTEGGARIPGLDHQAFAGMLQKLAGPTLRVEQELSAAAEASASASTGSTRLAAAAVKMAGAARGLQAEAKSSREKLARFERALGTAAEGPLLRVAQKAERRVHKRLARLPVVGFLTQNEFHDLQLASRKADDGMRGALDRSKALLDAVIRGAEGVIGLMGRFG